MLLAVEDAVSAAVCEVFLESIGVVVYSTIRFKGNSYLQLKAPELNRCCPALPVFVLTDLDSPTRCAPGLSFGWVPEGQRNTNFFLRVAVMEVESWVMADREGFSDFFGVPVPSIPKGIESIADPKETLVSIARKSNRKQVRDDVVPRSGSTAKVGRAYNATVVQFVRERWDPEVARRNSDSFRRTYDRLHEFANQPPPK